MRPPGWEGTRDPRDLQRSPWGPQRTTIRWQTSPLRTRLSPQPRERGLGVPGQLWRASDWPPVMGDTPKLFPFCMYHTRCAPHVSLGKKFVTRQLSPGRTDTSSLATKHFLSGGMRGGLPWHVGWVVRRYQPTAHNWLSLGLLRHLPPQKLSPCSQMASAHATVA